MDRSKSLSAEHHSSVCSAGSAEEQLLEEITTANLSLMSRIDELYLQWPFPRSRKYALTLGGNRKRVQRLIRLIGIEALRPKRRTTRRADGHKVYLYLLRTLRIDPVDQACSTDITYIPLRHGFVYLVANMDWCSRWGLSWRLSNTLESTFCVEALKDEFSKSRRGDLRQRSGRQFTDVRFTGRLPTISVNGRVALYTNVFIRTSVANPEVQGGVLAGLRRRLGSQVLSVSLLRVVLRTSDTLTVGLSDSVGGVRW